MSHILDHILEWVLDGILDIMTVVLWRLWILLHSFGKSCFLFVLFYQVIYVIWLKLQTTSLLWVAQSQLVGEYRMHAWLRSARHLDRVYRHYLRHLISGCLFSGSPPLLPLHFPAAEVAWILFVQASKTVVGFYSKTRFCLNFTFLCGTDTVV